MATELERLIARCREINAACDLEAMASLFLPLVECAAALANILPGDRTTEQEAALSALTKAAESSK